MLTCKQFDDFMDDFLDGRLPFRSKLSMHMHLGLCSDCRDYLKHYEQAMLLGQRMCREDEDLQRTVPKELIDAVLQHLDAPPDDNTP